MSEYSDFDLDIRVNGEGSTYATGGSSAPCALGGLTDIVEGSFKWCPSANGTCVTCGGDCTAHDCSGTCSDGHSYCAAVCAG